MEVVDLNNAQAAYIALLLQRPDRRSSRHCCSDLDFYRDMGVDVDATPRANRRRHRAAKLRSAIPASLSVFRELMRRPVGGTVVVLMPRTEVPEAPDDTIVIDELDLRNAS